MSPNIKKYFENNFSNSYFQANLKHIYVILIAISFFSFGFYFGNNLKANPFRALASSDSNLSGSSTINITTILQEVKNKFDNKFIFWKATSTLPTETDLNYGIIKGFVAAYQDPYSAFFTPSEAKMFTETIQGSFGGIGAQVDMKDGRVIIFAPLKDSPAEKIGLKAGDIILSVNGTSTEGMFTDKVVAMIRGEVGTIVKLEVLHLGQAEISKVEIKREIIKVPDMKTEIIDNIFVIHFYSFTANASINFEKALQEFIKSGKTKLLIDLRGNGGGFLEAAINTSSFFLPKDKIIVIEKGNKTDGDKINYSKGFNYFNPQVLKMVILIDGFSASASEIMAGALKDHKIATIVGEKSYGKGSVQQLETLSDGSALKITVAKWYTPNGVNISEGGIIPNIWASSTATTTLDKKTKKPLDLQLQKAIKILKKL